MEEIIIVSGQGRCGSTLLMKMLQRSGIPVVTDNIVSMEDNRAWHITKDSDWLSEAQGKAIKIIHAEGLCNLPADFKYKIVYLKRCFSQQALSWTKLQKARHSNILEQKLYNYMLQVLPVFEKTALQSFQRNNRPYIIIQFEELLTAPVKSLEAIKDFLGVDIDIAKMIEIIKSRSTDCAPDLDIDRAYAREKKLLDAMQNSDCRILKQHY